MKLRFRGPEPAFHLVLVNPEIPQNTGNIARLCAATGCALHLVGELGFSTDEKAVRRAGLDYWHLVRVTEHPELDSCLASIGEREPLLFTANTHRSYRTARFRPGATLIFGGESQGLPDPIIAAHEPRSYAIPTRPGSVRSLNLANAAAVVVYEGLRTIGSLDDMITES